MRPSDPGLYNLLVLPAALLLFIWSTAANEFELYLWDTFLSITLCDITIQIVTHGVDWFSCLAFVLLQYTPARPPNLIFYITCGRRTAPNFIIEGRSMRLSTVALTKPKYHHHFTHSKHSKTVQSLQATNGSASPHPQSWAGHLSQRYPSLTYMMLDRLTRGASLCWAGTWTKHLRRHSIAFVLLPLTRQNKPARLYSTQRWSLSCRTKYHGALTQRSTSSMASNWSPQAWICFFYSVYRPNFFWKDRKKLSQFGQNVRKGRLVNTVSANFNTIIRQVAEMSQRKEKRFESINNFLKIGNRLHVTLRILNPKILFKYISIFLMDSNLNIEKCKFESSQNDESRAQSTDSSKAVFLNPESPDSFESAEGSGWVRKH